jgi:hypothetical protein
MTKVADHFYDRRRGVMGNSWPWDKTDTAANVIVAVAAIVALVYAHLQIVESRRAERESNANELWRQTLTLGVDNTKLSDPSLKLADLQLRHSNHRWQQGTVSKIRNLRGHDFTCER